MRKDLDISTLEKGITEVKDIIDDKKKEGKSSYNLGQHEGHDVILKKGKFGLYITSFVEASSTWL